MRSSILRWETVDGVEVLESEAGSEVRFARVRTIRGSSALPSTESASWQITYIPNSDHDPNGVIGVCTDDFDSFDIYASDEKGVWCVRIGETLARGFNETDMENSGHHSSIGYRRISFRITFNADDRRLRIRSYAPDIDFQSSSIPAGKEVFPIISGDEKVKFLTTDFEDNRQEAFPNSGSYIRSLLDDSEDCDVEFILGSERVLAHSIILKRIPYFQRMLSGSFTESKKRKSEEVGKELASTIHTIAIHDFDATTVRRLLISIYSDDHEQALAGLQHAGVMALARAADMYGLIRLFDVAVIALEHLGTCSESCVLDVLEFAHRYKCNALNLATLGLVRRRFAAIALTQRFQKLPEVNPELYAKIVEEMGQQVVY